MLELLVQLDGVVQLEHLAVHADAREALAAQILQKLGMLALTALDDGSQDIGSATLREREHLVGNLVGRLTLDGAPALGTVRDACAGVQQAQVVVDLGHGAHGGTRVSAGGLLVDGHRWRQAVDRVQVRLVHLAQELTRVA